jgi:hypothetical protein
MAAYREPGQPRPGEVLMQARGPVTQAVVNRVAAKLWAFCDTLPDGEREIMLAILRSAAREGEGSGDGAGPTIFLPPPPTGSHHAGARGPEEGMPGPRG